MSGRGRPQFKVTSTLQRSVEEYVACGMSEDEISRAIGCSLPTLTKYFAEELLTGRSKRRAEVIALLFKNARKGNVAAQKKLEDMTAISASLQPSTERHDKPAAAVKLGKKEQAAVDAREPDTASPLGELMAERQGVKQTLN